MNPPDHAAPTDIPAVQPPQPPPLEAPLPENPDMKSLFEALLRRPQALIARLADGNPGTTRRFAIMAGVSFLLFGLVLGCFAKHEQLWAAPAKITLGLLFSGVICFPSLYIFSTLAGARVSIPQLTACLAGALALAGLLLLGFAPAVWIFAESTDSLGFMGSLALAAWIIAVIFALRFLKSAIFATGGTQQGPLMIWSGVFLLVTLQMTTSLRPILGRSKTRLTQEKMFFLQHWGNTFGATLEPPAASRPESDKPTTPAGSPPARGNRNSPDNH